ncbi:MAG: PepSY-associated TM helix domain-containing protein [Ferruginibacter sp.]
MKKNFILKLHSIAGLISGLFILLMSLSGAALVFHEEADNLQKPSCSNPSYKVISVDSCYASVQQAYPTAHISNCEIPTTPLHPFSFFIYDTRFERGTKAQEIFLHPATAAILGGRSSSGNIRNNFMGWVSKFHNSFHLGKTGEWLLGFFSLVFLLSIITGFILFRKKIVAVLLFRKTVYKRNNLHQLIGVWALVFNLMIAVTGFWMQRYVFKKEFYASYDYTPVLKASPAFPFKFDSAYAAVQKKYPDFIVRVVYFAQSNKGKTAMYGSRSSNAYIHSKKFADVIMLDSAGSIAKTRFVNEISADDRYDIINSQLHMGRFGGAGIKIIYFVFGLTGALLSITGFLLWWRRRKNSRKVYTKEA